MIELNRLTSVAQLGIWPPPYGGVAVHVRRLHQRLDALGIASTVYCQPGVEGNGTGRFIPQRPVRRAVWQTWLVEHGLWCRSQVLHCHMGWYWAPALLGLVTRRLPVVMTIHDQMTIDKYNLSTRLAKWSARRLLHSPRVHWIAVSPRIQGQLEYLGASSHRITVIPAYLPPPPISDPTSLVPPTLRSFLGSHTPVLSMYACRLRFDERGDDLYGVDLGLELVRRLKTDFPRIGLAVLLPEVGDDAYLSQLHERMKQFGIDENVSIATAPMDDAFPLWQASDVYLRPTTTDGDAVAVREALDLRVPVVASDASVRPQGSVVFPSRNASAFESAVRSVLACRRRYVEALGGVRMEDRLDDILDIYRRALAGPSGCLSPA